MVVGFPGTNQRKRPGLRRKYFGANRHFPVRRRGGQTSIGWTAALGHLPFCNRSRSVCVSWTNVIAIAAKVGPGSTLQTLRHPQQCRSSDSNATVCETRKIVRSTYEAPLPVGRSSA